MEGRFSNSLINDQESALENGSESPPSANITDGKMSTSTSSPKISRRAMQKRVVSVPIKDVEGSRLKGESAPPSDSWAWRKYGQKPIKGSPYPRGYYRCSSSKGCPARKQVERSRVDPTMLVVTYSCEHNHPWPAASSSRNSNVVSSTTAAVAATPTLTPEPPKQENSFSDICEESLISTDEFSWFSGMESNSSTMLENPIFEENGCVRDADLAVYFPMREEDELLFADLEELPECSVVFRRGVVETRPPLSQLSAGIS